MNIKKFMSAALLGAILLLMTSCSGKPVEVIKYFDDSYVMEHYAKEFTDYDYTEYERTIIEWQNAFGFEMSIGPHEPGYRGVIYLTPEQAQSLMDSYEWAEAEPSDVEFQEVDYDVNKDDKWYSSKEFDKELFSMVAVNYVYFNGVDAIVYDIHVT